MAQEVKIIQLRDRPCLVYALKILHQVTTSRYVPDHSIALVYLGLGDQDQAMNWLEKPSPKDNLTLIPSASIAP